MIKDRLSLCQKSKEKYSTQLCFYCACFALHGSFPPALFAVDWGEDKIKATAAISSLLAPWQIGPLSNRGLIYQAKDGYWNCPTGHKSDQWIGLYLRQGRHHSVVTGRGGTRPFKSLSCVSLLMDVARLTSLWPGAAGLEPNLCLTWIIIWPHACVWFSFTLKTLTLSYSFVFPNPDMPLLSVFHLYYCELSIF